MKPNYPILRTRLVSLLVLLLLIPLWATAQDATFRATLTGRSETNPVPTTAFGEVTAELTGNSLAISGLFTGLSADVDTSIAGGAHVHMAYAGQNGGVVFPLFITFDENMRSGTFDPEDNTFELDNELVQALQERRLYVNIHSLNYASGEIRGQLLPDAETYFASNLFGSYENPPVVTEAHGAVAIEVRDSQMVLTGSFADLEGDFAADVAGGAHIHLGFAGQNGGIQIPINATVDADLRSGVFEASNNTFTLTEEQRTALSNRQLYVNIHTNKSRSGEIRGQIVSNASLAVFRAHLSGSNESNPVTTTATGMVIAEVFDTTIILISGSFSGLESDLATDIAGGAHIHRGLAGTNGGVITPLTVNAANSRSGVFMPNDNLLPIGSAEIERLFDRGIYVNVHSADNRSGEIRGQLLPESPINFTGYLSSIFEVPETSSRASGGVKAELLNNKLTVSGSFSGLSSPVATSIAGGAHIHLGFAGSTGGVQFPLSLTLNSDSLGGSFAAADNMFMLTDEQVSQFRARQYYVNIHSENVRSGEIRTQLVNEATTYFVAPLSGASGVPSVNTPASGMVIVEVGGGNAVATGSFNGLESGFAEQVAGGAHIHQALSGSNGGIVVSLSATTSADERSGTFQASNNVFPISAGLLDTMRNRMHYVNIHSDSVRSGEIRGQLLPLATSYFTTTLAAINEVPPQSSTARGGLKFDLVGSRLTITGSFDDLQGAFDPSVAGGSHIHLAGVGQNGGIQFGMNVVLDADSLGGRYPAAMNTFTLTPEQLDALYASNLYANIHTKRIRSGEARGQVLPEINRFPEGGLTFNNPPNGAVITIEGDSTTAFAPSWEPATDRDPLAYILQIAPSPSFDTLLFQTLVTEPSFEADYAALDALLEEAGVAIGDTVQVYHRVIASDGAVQTYGTPETVTLIRGVLGDGQEDGVDLQLSISSTTEAYDIYVPVPYEITVTNNGTDMATNIVVSLPFPQGMVFTSSNTSAGSYNTFFKEWSVPELASGQSATLTLTLFPLVQGSSLTIFGQVVAADQDDVDSTPDNNDGTTPNEDDEAALTIESTFMPPVGGDTADLALEVEVANNEYSIYRTITYNFTLTNNGPDDAANVVVTTTIPAGLVNTSNMVSAGRYGTVSQRWEIPMLESGATATFQLVLFALVGDVPLTVSAAATSDQDDPDMSDNEASVTVSPQSANANTFNTALQTTTVTIDRLYPVPTTSNLTMEFAGQEDKTITVQVFDASGKLVLSQQEQVVEGFNMIDMDVSNLAEGMYFIQLPQVELQAPMQFIKTND